MERSEPRLGSTATLFCGFPNGTIEELNLTEPHITPAPVLGLCVDPVQRQGSAAALSIEASWPQLWSCHRQIHHDINHDDTHFITKTTETSDNPIPNPLS
jgi:hypothetical protein